MRKPVLAYGEAFFVLFCSYSSFLGASVKPSKDLVILSNIVCLADIKHFISYPLCDLDQMSLVMRKPAFCICENKDADHLRGNREADQRLCFRYTDSTIPLQPKSEISSH